MTACAAALAVIEAFAQEKLLARSQDMGALLVRGLKDIAAKVPAIGDVRGLGAMVAIELFENGDLSRPDAALTKQVVAEAARRAGMSAHDLRSVNSIPPRMLIKAGSALIVPRLELHAQDVPQQLANNARLEFTPEYSLVTKRKAIRVQRGDTLSSLAKRHNVSAHQLTSWNKLPANAGLRIGQTLSIYTEVQQAIRSQASGKRTTANNKKAAPAKRVAQAAPQKRGGTPAKRKR
mgnify:CR=1 FL=1